MEDRFSIESKADSTTVESFIRTLVEYKYERSVSEDASKWADYGLESSAREVSLTRGSETRTIYVGREAPVGYSVYFRTDQSDQVYLGSQYLLTATGKTLNEFRDRSIVNLKPENVSELRYVVGGEQIMRAQLTDGRFSIVEPKLGDGDHSEIFEFVAEVSRIKAEDFLDQPSQEFVQEFRKSRAVLSIQWQTADNEQGGFTIAGVKDEFWVMVDGRQTAYKISADTMKVLRRELISFRKRQLAEFDVNEVQAVEIDGQRFEKKDQDYYAKDEANGERKIHVQNLVSDLAWAKAERFIETGAPEAANLNDSPMHTIRLEFDAKSQRSPLQFKVWKAAGVDNKIVVQIEGNPNIFYLGDDLITNVQDVPIESGDDIEDFPELPAGLEGGG
jgi:hypothetical protein